MSPISHATSLKKDDKIADLQIQKSKIQKLDLLTQHIQKSKIQNLEFYILVSQHIQKFKILNLDIDFAKSVIS